MRWISKNKCFANRNIKPSLKTQYAIRVGALFLLSAISINAIAAGGGAVLVLRVWFIHLTVSKLR